MPEESIFTKIINGEIPCYKVYEDDKTLAFLDIHPIQPGHTLVVPKKQIDHLWDLDSPDYQAVMETCRKVSLHLRAVLGTKRVGAKVFGLDVPHAHVHLVPFNTPAEFRRIADQGAEPDHTGLKAMQAKVSLSEAN